MPFKGWGSDKETSLSIIICSSKLVDWTSLFFAKICTHIQLFHGAEIYSWEMPTDENLIKRGSTIDLSCVFAFSWGKTISFIPYLPFCLHPRKWLGTSLNVTFDKSNFVTIFESDDTRWSDHLKKLVRETNIAKYQMC